MVDPTMTSKPNSPLAVPRARNGGYLDAEALQGRLDISLSPTALLDLAALANKERLPTLVSRSLTSTSALCIRLRA